MWARIRSDAEVVNGNGNASEGAARGREARLSRTGMEKDGGYSYKQWKGRSWGCIAEADALAIGF